VTVKVKVSVFAGGREDPGADWPAASGVCKESRSMWHVLLSLGPQSAPLICSVHSMGRLSLLFQDPSYHCLSILSLCSFI